LERRNPQQAMALGERMQMFLKPDGQQLIDETLSSIRKTPANLRHGATIRCSARWKLRISWARSTQNLAVHLLGEIERLKYGRGGAEVEKDHKPTNELSSMLKVKAGNC